jgi:hypothetical protein
LLFYLPGSINPEEIIQYNWLNQSLIEVKITVKEFILYLISNPSNPGDPGLNGTPNSPISPITSEAELNKYLPKDGSSSISPSISSDGMSTVTPNTPRISNLTLLDQSTQTDVDSLSVGKMVETVNILEETLGE